MCASVFLTQKFEASAANANNTDINSFLTDMFIQYVADNVYHSLRTLDGHNTFHGMGLVACITLGKLWLFNFQTDRSLI